MAKTNGTSQATSPAKNDAAMTDEDHGVSINVLANDSGLPKQIHSLSQTDPSSPTAAGMPSLLILGGHSSRPIADLRQ